MKQKQVKAAPKTAKQTKTSKKAPPPKKVEEVVEENEDEDEEEVEVAKKVVVAKKQPAKKAAASKVQKKVVEVVQEVEEEEEDEDEEDDDMPEEAVDEEEDDAEEEDEMDVDEEAEDDEEEDDEAPEEAEIEKEEPTLPSKVKSGPIPDSLPVNKQVRVIKLPKKTRQIDIVESFAKFGAIDQIHLLTTSGGTVANIAFKTEKAAKAAAAETKKVKVHDSLVWISVRREKSDDKKPKKPIEDRERTVYLRYLKEGTTEEDLKQHFESCGDIHYVKLMNKFKKTYGFVSFADKSAVEAALKLHNSVLNDVNIGVFGNNENHTKLGQWYNEKLTVTVKNTQNFEKIDGSKIETIFAKCGEIESIDVVCKKNVLAFVTFKTEQAAQKALKLSGKTEQGIELSTELYDPFNKKTTIYVSNLPKGCTEEDLTKCFSRAGEIGNIILKGAYAIIRFVDSDAYCKSFLYNECFIQNQMIFVEPHSIRKQTFMKNKLAKNFNKKGGFKRPAENGVSSVFKPKKPRTN